MFKDLITCLNCNSYKNLENVVINDPLCVYLASVSFWKTMFLKS